MKISDITTQLEEIYSGGPWYGDSISCTLNSISADSAISKPPGLNHSIVDLVYHIITWRHFIIKQLRGEVDFDVRQNDKNDWQDLNYGDENLWKNALSDFDRIHKLLISELGNFKENALTETAPLRKYTYEFLLTGLIQHDMYHLGQISLLKSILKKQADSL